MVFTAFTTLFANPFEIQAVRYQHYEYKRTHVFPGMSELWGREGVRLFTMGYLHAYLRNMIIMTTLLNHEELGESFPVAVAAAVAISHPFDITRIRTQWGADPEMGANPIYSVYKLYGEGGWRALTTGLVPRMVLLSMLGSFVMKVTEKIED